MKRPLSTAFLFLAFAFPLIATAQYVRGQDLMADLTRSMDEARRKIPNMVVSNDLIRGTDPIAFLEILDTYLEEDSEEVRREAYSTMARTARIHPTPNVRRRVVDSLVAGLEDPSRRVRRITGPRLNEFLARDFSPQAKQTLRERLHSALPPDTADLQFVGVAGIAEEIPFIESLLGPTQKIYRAGVFDRRSSAAHLEWMALLILARLGEDRAAQRAVEIVDSEPTIPLKSRAAGVYLTYTRHPVAVDYVFNTFLFSEARMGKGTNDYPVAWSGASMLSIMLDNFPSINESADRLRLYRDDDLETVRAWARQQTTWVLKK